VDADTQPMERFLRSCSHTATMRRSPTALIATVAVVALITPAAAGGVATTADESGPTAVGGPPGPERADERVSDHDDCAPVSEGTRENPSSDRLGWEDGCWYDDEIDVTRSDGLNETELAAVVARSMARVERIRELEFGKRPPVEIVARETYAEQTADRYEGASAADRLHQNVKFEALFMINESADALAAQQRNRASGTLGYYDAGSDEIVIVSENTTAPEMDEITLSQELFHALQYDQFDVASWTSSTEEGLNAENGIVEGDGNYVDYRYERRCEDNWSCLEPRSRPDAGDRHVGLLALQLQPYSDGPVFVREIYRERGWEGVDDVYEHPPQSTEQTIHTDRYRSDPPSNVTVTDTASNGWHVLDLSSAVDYAEFGEAGMYAMLWYPAFETRYATDKREVIPLEDWPARESDLDLYSYDHPYTDGWDGDRLYPYVNDTANRTGETGYVWKSVWDSPDEAAEFVDGYTALLGEFDATSVDGRANTYRIPDDAEFGDAFYVDRTGDAVVVVNAPDVASLSDVRRGAAPEVEVTPTPASGEPTTTPTRATASTSGPSTTGAQSGADGGASTATPTGGTTAGAGGPGPGLAGAVVAVALVLAALALPGRER